MSDAVAPVQPAALRLPVELWVRVLLINQILSYGDLHRFSRVCKHFRRLRQVRPPSR